MRACRAITPIYDERVPADGVADVFHSFVDVPGGTLCAWRRMEFVVGEAPRSSVRLGEWSGDALINDRRIVDHGEDPRAFRFGDSAMVLVRVVEPDCPSSYVLYDVAAGHAVTLRLPADLPLGKNWMPFGMTDRVGAIHGFSPFRRLEINSCSGVVTVVDGPREIGLGDLHPHDGYSAYRGGSNSLSLGFGCGRLKITPDVHIPFLWGLAGTDEPSLEFIDVAALTADGFGIIDPASLRATPDNRLLLSVSCSEVHWHAGQRFASYVLELESAEAR